MMTPDTKAIDQGPSKDSPTKCLTHKGKMEELDEAMLQIAHILENIEHTSQISLNRIRSERMKSIQNKRH